MLKLKIVGTASSLTCLRLILPSLKAGPIKRLVAIFCTKQSSVKCAAQMRECFDGLKNFLLIRGNLKVLTFDEEIVLQFNAAQETMFPFKVADFEHWKQNRF